jgi:UDP-GlcNAc:undecaprenyl-phosphate GlcNAc-1-phosphate transferase
MNLFWTLAVVGASFSLSFFTTWLTIPLADRLSFIDRLSTNSIHSNSTTRLGGIGYILPFLLFIFLCKLNILPNEIAFFSKGGFSLVIASLLLLITLGLLDDRYGLTAAVKLPVQIVVSILIVYSGLLFDFQIFANPTVNLVTNTLFTITWILILINSINFIDGLDGLACKVSINILFFLIFFDVFILKENANYIELMVLISCLFGFLFFNRYPARTFMGDTGSTFLGAILAVYTLEMGLPGRVSSMLTTPLILFLFPFFDVICAIVRRSYKAQKNSEIKHVLQFITVIFTGDKEHIHHKLLELNGDHRKTVRILVLVNFLTGIISIVFFFSERIIKSLILVLLLLVMSFILLKLHYLPGIPVKGPLLKFLERNNKSRA